MTGVTGVFCVPFYSHVAGIRNGINRVLPKGSTLIIFVHHSFFNLFEGVVVDYQCTLVDVDWMIGPGYSESYGSKGLGYIADAMKALYQYLEPCEQLIAKHGVTSILTDSVTRWPVVAAQRLELPYTTRASLYPIPYQRTKLSLVRGPLLKNLLTQPLAVPSMAWWITKVIMTHKPIDKAQAYSWFFDDSSIEHWVDLDSYFFDAERLKTNPTMKIGHVPTTYDSSLTKQTLIEAGCPRSEQQLRANDKVLYCALGSLIGISEKGERTLEKLASQGRRVLCGSGSNGRSGIHKGVRYTPFAPQLACLDVAKLFITHAGPKSCMEAVEQSVPMICYPHLEDQFMYADRMKQVGYGEVVSEWSEVEKIVIS